MYLLGILALAAYLPTAGGRSEDVIPEAYQLLPSDLQPEDIAIVQYDTRPIDENYWGVVARWNYAYARQHGHPYYFLSSVHPKDCRYSDVALSVVWCKVCRQASV